MNCVLLIRLLIILYVKLSNFKPNLLFGSNIWEFYNLFSRKKREINTFGKKWLDVSMQYFSNRKAKIYWTSQNRLKLSIFRPPCSLSKSRFTMQKVIKFCESKDFYFTTIIPLYQPNPLPPLLWYCACPIILKGPMLTNILNCRWGQK